MAILELIKNQKETNTRKFLMMNYHGSVKNINERVLNLVFRSQHTLKYVLLLLLFGIPSLRFDKEFFLNTESEIRYIIYRVSDPA